MKKSQPFVKSVSSDKNIEEENKVNKDFEKINLNKRVSEIFLMKENKKINHIKNKIVLFL